VRHARRRTRATQAPAAGVSESLPHAAACAAPCQQPAPRRAHAAACVRVVRHAGEGGTHTMPACRIPYTYGGEACWRGRARLPSATRRAPHPSLPCRAVHTRMPAYTYTLCPYTPMPYARIHVHIPHAHAYARTACTYGYTAGGTPLRRAGHRCLRPRHDVSARPMGMAAGRRIRRARCRRARVRS
jgi:hypothetical protein